jgi:hypothetical protein
MEKFTRRKMKRGIWFHFSFLESPRFSLPTKEKISVHKLKHKYKKVYKKKYNFLMMKTESHERKKI